MLINHILFNFFSVYYPDRTQPIAEGHEVIEKTIGGAQADLNLFGRIRTYLTFKRGMLYGHTPAITDLEIIGKVILMRWLHLSYADCLQTGSRSSPRL